MAPSREIARLLEIMAALRTPESGCPWDLQQDFASIAPYTIEEAYEVADAIQRSNLEDLKDELGDLLLQVVFHARMAEERGVFDFGAVVEAITSKLLRRHPHVFGDIGRHSAADVEGLWARIKAEEKRGRGAPHSAGVLANVPVALPALTRAWKLQEQAATVGFDWNDPRAVLAKIREETDEIDRALDGRKKEETVAEIGDLMFAVVNLARHTGADPEAILRQTNAKFERRFRFIEEKLAATGRKPAETSLDEMDRLWDEAKAAERAD
ncbi:MAG: nucleoside triphosphate pyrophosphohydrolase [Methylobacteriaceae bacterium]|nr:nucleoside triphosphate pyrophosphohydrolase [Methylobacteriaceae bacterium]